MEFNGNVAILKIKHVEMDDSAEYTCRMVNDIGERSTSAFLHVEGQYNRGQ